MGSDGVANLCAATLSVSSIIAYVDALADLIFLGILLVIAIFCIFFDRYLPFLEVRSLASLATSNIPPPKTSPTLTLSDHLRLLDRPRARG